MLIGSPIYTDSQNARMILKLFPQGDAFPSIEGNELWNFVLGLGQEFLRIDVRVNQLVAESTPEATDELIAEYEGDYGFPDESFSIPDLLADRRTQVYNREIFPLYLATGWTDSGTATAGSPIITGLSDTSEIYAGDVVTVSTEIGSGKYAVTDKTVDSITLEQNMVKAGSPDLVAYFGVTEQSERFYSAVALSIGCEITAFEYYGMCLIGTAAMGDDIGDGKRFTVKISFDLVSATSSAVLESFFDKLKPALWTFLYSQN